MCISSGSSLLAKVPAYQRSHRGVVDKSLRLYPGSQVQSQAPPVYQMRLEVMALSPHDLSCQWDIKHYNSHLFTKGSEFFRMKFSEM